MYLLGACEYDKRIIVRGHELAVGGLSVDAPWARADDLRRNSLQSEC